MVEEEKKDAPADAPEAGKDEPVAKKAVAEEKKIGKFTHGDHMVHILFQKGKKFIPACEEDRTANLIIEVEVNGETQYSSPKDDTLTDSDSPVTWGEHLFFELRNLSPQKAKDVNINIRVLNRGFLKNELLGQAMYDLSSIYFNENNKVEHVWVGLENPDAEDFENMKGLLMISANVTGPKDNAQKLESQQGPEPEKMNMFMSPSIKRTFNQLTISIIEGHNLPEYGTFSASLECYFKVFYGGGNPVKTDVHNQINKKVPVNQKFLLPVQTPVLQDRLVIEVYDWNLTSDTIIGSLILSTKKLIAEGSKPGGFYMWRSIYGSPPDNTNAHADAMNKNPNMASDWKGMVLLHIDVEEEDKPKKGMETMDPEIKTRAIEEGYMEYMNYEMMVEIGQGVTLPKPDHNYKIQVSIMDSDWTCALPKEKKGEYVRWSDRSGVINLKLPKNKFSEYSNNDADEDEEAIQLEYRVYIYLQDEDDVSICFWWGELSEFGEMNAKWRWINLKPDRSHGMVENDYEAGMVSVKMAARKVPKNGQVLQPWNKFNAWRKDPPRRIGAYQLRCFLFQCRDLPAADSDGSSDPYIKIFNTTGEDVVTTVIEDNVNPIFMECKDVALDFLDFQNFEDAPPVIMDVLDADEGFISTTADFLGRCTIYLKDVNLSDDLDSIPEPEWYDIKFGTDPASPACGQILCSFALFPGDALPPPVDIMPKRMNDMVEKLDMDVFINCLGLRELESIGLMPIQKAFVSFMVKSLTDPKQSGSLNNIKTQPGPSGSNPNINSVVKFNIPLPVAELYCPSLSCTIYDQVFLGLSQPVVGTFSIPLGTIMQDMIKEREKILSTAKDLIVQLRSKLDDRIINQNDIVLEEAEKMRNMDTMDDTDMHEIEDEEVEMLKKAAGADDDLGAKNLKKTKFKSVKKANDDQRQQAEDLKRQKDEAKLARKDEVRKLLETVDASNNVSIPNYTLDPQLRVYREVMPPKNELFMSVGYNDQDLIKEIMALQDKIPAAAANSSKIQRTNNMLAKKMKKEVAGKFKQNAAIMGVKVPETPEHIVEEKQPFGESDIDKAVEIMQQIYDKTNKHYRRFFEDELEHDLEIFPKPVFYTAEIQRGQSRGVESSWFSFGGGQQDESGQESTIRTVGKFKGTIEITNPARKQKFEDEKDELLKEMFEVLSELYQKKTGEHKAFDLSCAETSEDKATFIADCDSMGFKMPKLVALIEDISFAGMIKQLLTKQTDAIVHLYLLQGTDFASRDIGSPSDPYLIVTCGDTCDNDQDNYQNDEANPKFMKRLDFNVSFPGAPPLVIEAYDYDLLFGDDLIGKTSVDLDDRFFNPKWQAIDEKPIETRELYHSSSTLNQGVIDMWVDIDPVSKTSDCGKVWEVSKEPDNEFEVRLSIFKGKGVPMEDAEGTSDVFIKCKIGENDQQETDTHYRETNGRPSFNYRLLFNLKTPTKKPFVLTMQAWDRDLIKSNDLICEWQLDITDMVRDSKITKGPINMQRKYYEESLAQRIRREDQPEPLRFCEKESEGNTDSTFILTTFSPDDKKKKKPIDIFLDLRIVPREFADMNQVGAARADPNVEPYLPPPVGRFKLSLNPFAMLNQLCGAALRRKIWCCICCIFCTLVIYYVFPLIASFVTIFKK